MVEICLHWCDIRKKEIPKEEGNECDAFSSMQILVSERNRYSIFRKYMDAISHRWLLHDKNLVCFNKHILGMQVVHKIKRYNNKPEQER